MEWWLALYWSLAVVVVIVGTLLGVQSWEHRRFARSRTRNPNRQQPRGRVALFVPCKGADADCEANLRRLFEQDHDNYELVFIVESLDDNACPVIRRLISQYPRHSARLVVAGLATGCGQKVHNLLAGTERLSSAVEYLAFVDADVRPPCDWLRLLTQRLHNHQAATGYRRFVPKRRTLANFVLASIDSAVVSIMIPSVHHMVWGGSWAIRRDAFESGRLRDAWEGTLSDDLVAGRMLSRLRMRVAFEPNCILPSPLDMDLAGMFAFARRQFTIGRFYSATLWIVASTWVCLSQAMFWGTLGAVAWGLYTRAEWTWQFANVAGVLYFIHLYRAWMRQGASRYYLPGWQDELAAARWFDILLGPVAALVCCCGLISSAVGKRIVWKSIAYEMRNDGHVCRVVRLARPAAPGTRVGGAEIEALRRVAA